MKDQKQKKREKLISSLNAAITLREIAEKEMEEFLRMVNNP